MEFESPSLPLESSTNVPSNLQCSVCHNLYRDPVNLLCFHTFCRRCINELRQDNSSDLACPKCKSFLKDGWKKIQENIFIRSLVKDEEEKRAKAKANLVKVKENSTEETVKGEGKISLIKAKEDELNDDLKEGKEEEVKSNTEEVQRAGKMEGETRVKAKEGTEEETKVKTTVEKQSDTGEKMGKEEVDLEVETDSKGEKDIELKTKEEEKGDKEEEIEEGRTMDTEEKSETEPKTDTEAKTEVQVKEDIKATDYSSPSKPLQSSTNVPQHCSHRNANDKDLECPECKAFQNGSRKHAKRAHVEEEELMKSTAMEKVGLGITSRPDIFPESLKLARSAPDHVSRPLFGAYKMMEPLLADQDQSLGQTHGRPTGPSQEVYHRNSSGPQACARAERVNKQGEMGISAETARDTPELLPPPCTEEVSCHVCTGKCLRAVKSCLVCLTSYCEDHIKSHNARFTKHKLVEPVVNLEERMCKEHERLQELFCKQDQTTLCVLCTETDHRTHCTVPVEREWSEKKTELLKTKDSVEEKIQERMRKLTEFQTSALDCKDRIEAEEQEVHGVFEEVLKAVRSAQEEALRPLRERRRRLEEEEQRLRQELEEEMRKLEAIATDLSQLLHLEDPIQFLQKYPKEPDMKGGRDWEDVIMDTELNFPSLRNITTTMLNEIQAELEKLTALEIRRVQKFSVDVTLDQDTANPHLRVSRDGKEVSHGSSPLDIPDVPQRFDIFSSLLGQNQLSSGRAYWEVEVGDKTGWDIGVASEAANRKGQISFEPAYGYWALVLYGEGCYAALDDPKVNLSLPSKPQKVGVFVDHEAGLVSFYDLEVKGHIYSFTGCSFASGLKLFPYFSPHFPNGQRNSAPLVISPVKQGA